MNKKLTPIELVDLLVYKYPELEQAKNRLLSFLNESKVRIIEMKHIKSGALGVSLHDRVIIDPKLLKRSLYYTLYIIFHEIAHQYQYKKYGVEKMYSFYNNEISLQETVNFMKKCEDTADRFAISKVKQLERSGIANLKGVYNLKPNYKNLPLIYFEQFITQLRSIIGSNSKDYNKVSAILYNIFVEAMY